MAVRKNNKQRPISKILVSEPDGHQETLICVRRTPDYPNPGRRLLLRYDLAGVYLYCKFCRMEHAIDWDALFAERLRLEGEGGNGEAGGETSR
jgi:hypothetical protein